MKGFIDNARDERQTELGLVMEECTIGCSVCGAKVGVAIERRGVT